MLKGCFVGGSLHRIKRVLINIHIILYYCYNKKADFFFYILSKQRWFKVVRVAVP